MHPESPRTVFNFKLMLFKLLAEISEFRYYSNSRVFFQNHPGSSSINIKIKCDVTPSALMLMLLVHKIIIV